MTKKKINLNASYLVREHTHYGDVKLSNEAIGHNDNLDPILIETEH